MQNYGAALSLQSQCSADALRNTEHRFPGHVQDGASYGTRTRFTSLEG